MISSLICGVFETGNIPNEAFRYCIGDYNSAGFAKRRMLQGVKIHPKLFLIF